MKTESFLLHGAGGRDLPGMIWLPDREPRLVLQVTHGMTEHMGRYAALAGALARDGVVTAGFDLRGHGRSPGSPQCASFGEGGWLLSLEDMHLLRELLERRFPGLPQVMLGFSLGSFLVRDYLNSYLDQVSGAIILGTGCQPAPLLTVLKRLVQSQIRAAGFDACTPLVRQLSFGAYNRGFAPCRTPMDWLCADEEELDSYRADSLCRAEISSGLFYQLLDSMQRTGSSRAYDRWDRDMPVLLMSGRDDPVGSRGRGVRQVGARMEQAGFRHVSVRLLDGARHDLLHEHKCGADALAVEEIRSFLRPLMD